ncbi:uncharacterized protein A1O5_00427 [Cladophialophora psammophila CBS 110553]|uniref:Uncharacterized protein n=1 Tax=Cladophialophora psammophila CBS 110553 TaxID=1182543 RepID=W9Y0A7_9EURO|nr:uncharacterized protein A1O5_00427 [Cladophialophora psammophila CBS 110553]EXJ75919.1 hypothetical protein A1O5_00427 [Cladophialophora psammophila CBS 110553]
MRFLRALAPLRPTQAQFLRSPLRSFNTTCKHAQSQHTSSTSSPQPDRPVNFYSTHGRAFFKAITLAFLTYQIAYWAWLTLETEYLKDEKNREIKSLEQEVRILDEGRKAHRPGTT